LRLLLPNRSNPVFGKWPALRRIRANTEAEAAKNSSKWTALKSTSSPISAMKLHSGQHHHQLWRNLADKNFTGMRARLQTAWPTAGRVVEPDGQFDEFFAHGKRRATAHLELMGCMKFCRRKW
jgi:hypothetical protein